MEEKEKEYTIKERLIKNELEIADVFTISFALYKFNLAGFFIIALLSSLPLELLLIKLPLPFIEISMTKMPDITEAMMKTLGIHLLANMASLTMMTISVSITIESMIQRRYISALGAILFALKRFIPTFVTMFAYMFFASMGFAFLVLPGIIFSVFFIFAIYMSAIRRVGVFDAFKTSFFLVKKNFLKIFLVASFVFLFQLSFAFLVGGFEMKTNFDVLYYVFSRVFYYLMIGYLHAAVSVLFINFDYNYNGRKFFRTV